LAQPDLGSAGGITAVKKIATIAETHYVLMTPYVWGGPIITAAALHIGKTAISSYRIDRALALSWTNPALKDTGSDNKDSA
jgi:galactonate dehydratase